MGGGALGLPVLALGFAVLGRRDRNRIFAGHLEPSLEGSLVGDIPAGSIFGVAGGWH